MGVRVMVVEDDPRIRASLRLALTDEGYEVHEAGSAEQALEVFVAAEPDAVLLDVMLPGMDGFQCCRQLRRLGDVPIIVITARSDTHDVVAGLEAGADDYVTKPFQVKELAARLRAVLRRSQPVSLKGTPTVVGDLEVRPDEGVVRLRGADVALTRTEFRLLCELAEVPGRVLSRERLLERVWEYGYFGDARLVDVHVRRLRTKIEDDPSEPHRLVTVRGLGYKLATP